MEQINIKTLQRRIFTFALWPTIDFLLTLFSFSLLATFDAWVAVPVMAVAITILNLFFFHMLSLEKEIPSFFPNQRKTLKEWEKRIPGLDRGKNIALLAVYTISGPAMVGTPLLWLLGVRGKRAHAIILFGSFLNALLWTGGIFNLFWFLIKVLVVKTKAIL